nr:MAG TPA: hypothetical protein [Caudoviricetes sp.]
MGRARGQAEQGRSAPTQPGPFRRQARPVVLRFFHIPGERERNA